VIISSPGDFNEAARRKLPRFLLGHAVDEQGHERDATVISDVAK
jgi:hypothetical protein